MKKPQLLLLTFSMLTLLILSGCGSELTNIDSPSAVEPLEKFDVAISHVYSEEEQELPTGGDGFFLVYSAVIPSDWTASDTGVYYGERDGTPFEETAVLLSEPPESIIVDLLNAEEPPPEPETTIFTNLDCKVSPPSPSAAESVVWYQISLADQANVVAGDAGRLVIQLTSGEQSGSFTISFQHAFQAINPDDASEAYCTFYFDPSVVDGDPEDVTADEISAVINQLSSATFVPVPTLGAGMLAFLAAMMVLSGVLIGRRRVAKGSA